MADKVFTDGMIIKWLGPNDPNRRQNAPDFVLGSISFKCADFYKCMKENNNDGWMNVDIKRSQGGKLYAEVDTWKKEQQQPQQQAPVAKDNSFDPPPPTEDTRDFSNGNPDDNPFDPTQDIPF